MFLFSVYTLLVWFYFFLLGPLDAFDGKFYATTFNINVNKSILPTLWQEIAFDTSLFKMQLTSSIKIWFGKLAVEELDQPVQSRCSSGLIGYHQRWTSLKF